MWSLLKEFLKFARQEKKWWLIPLVVVLLLLGAILIFTASSGIAWALYPFLVIHARAAQHPRRLGVLP